jgi:hypothetical protein
LFREYLHNGIRRNVDIPRRERVATILSAEPVRQMAPLSHDTDSMEKGISEHATPDCVPALAKINWTTMQLEAGAEEALPDFIDRSKVSYGWYSKYQPGSVPEGGFSPKLSRDLNGTRHSTFFPLDGMANSQEMGDTSSICDLDEILQKGPADRLK